MMNNFQVNPPDECIVIQICTVYLHHGMMVDKAMAGQEQDHLQHSMRKIVSPSQLITPTADTKWTRFQWT